MADEKKVQLPADATLTKDNFLINGDGSVTVKNSDLSKFLAEKLQSSVADQAKKNEYIGVVWG
jgi:hypothetical protein